MIDIIIPFVFGLMIGAGGGVMIAALLVASRESEKIGEKTGRWIRLPDNLFKCSECGEAIYDCYADDYGPDRYCRNCGARMEEDKDGRGEQL